MYHCWLGSYELALLFLKFLASRNKRCLIKSLGLVLGLISHKLYVPMGRCCNSEVEHVAWVFILHILTCKGIRVNLQYLYIEQRSLWIGNLCD